MEYINIIIQAVVQGLTEFLPVSSSGHLSVLQHFMNIGEESLTISIVLHLGTLIAVFIAFGGIILGMIKEFFLTLFDIFTGKFKWSSMNDNRRMMFGVIVASAVLVPAYFFKDYFTSVEGDGDIIFEGCAFIFTAVLLFLSDACAKGAKTGKDITVSDALTVGIFQCIALFPGVSRSGSTISGGLFRGLARGTAVSFSFILGIPAILGGSLLEIKEALDTNPGLNFAELAVGFAVAAAVGFFAIKLVRLIAKHDKFRVFGIYTALLGAACIAYGIFEKVSGYRIVFNL